MPSKLSGHSPNELSAEIGIRIREYRKALGITSTALAKALHVSNASITNWETGLNRPDSPVLIRLCDYLGITPNDLYGYDSALNQEESLLLRRYSRLSSQNKQYILSFMDIMGEHSPSVTKSISRSGFLKVPVAIDKVCAGPGFDLSADIPEESLFLRRMPETEKCDIVVQVSGQSMVPLYNDGERVLLQLSQSVYPGEIGIFRVNGSGMIKQFFQDHLHAINPAFDDIYPKPDDEVICIGRVIAPLLDTFLPTDEELELLGA